MRRTVWSLIVMLWLGHGGSALAAAYDDFLNAVKNGKVIAIDPDLLTRPGPRLIDGLEALEKAMKGR